ncbi:hypothetical protein DCM90_03920 [Levilactobacillus bambusae]|uniref:Uncharacterized protein n=2 Tax=Levilactobacillus bambusae TaxID=2024736 RepID=A0A2V1N042_9LACO|nr:hypothetical protein DCM90_03920 [Levilactobacillus bambusae]
MNDFLMDYAGRKFGRTPGLAQRVYDAGKNDLTGLDTLFEDDGVGRRTKYLEIAAGNVRNMNDERNGVDSQPLTDDNIRDRSQALAEEAMAYLGGHTTDFDRWEDD